MIDKTIAVHSSRGGTGKTIISTNLAVILARRGLKMALLDLDFRAPSLATVFSKDGKGDVKCWLNDFLNGKCKAEQVLVDVSKKHNLKGKLLVGFANPSIEAIRGIAEKSSAWEVTAVKRIFSLLTSFFDEMDMDYCILDTSPGVQYSSINAVVSSDVSVVITTLDSLDLKGTENMLFDLYDALERKAVVLVNKYSPETRILSSASKEEVVGMMEKKLKHQVIGVLPCYCDVLQADRGSLLAIEKPNHPFIEKLEEIAEKLVHLE
jgi:MinD-like ATPase involved in chromosome partitioning or flagellar assembly